MTKDYSLRIDEADWQPAGAPADIAAGRVADERSALSVVVDVNGLVCQLLAVQVVTTPDGHQEALAPEHEETLDHLWAATGAQGPFGALEIDGRHYVVLLAPLS